MTTPTRPSAGARLRAIAISHYREPPWYVRVVGAAFLCGSLGVYLLESLLARPTPHTTMELIWHGMFILVGLLMLYPEGARAILGLLRRLPAFDRRQGPRP